MTATTSDHRSEWSRLADRLTVDHQGYEIAIEMLEPDGEDDPLVERLPFRSITYDHKDDAVVIAVGGEKPRFPVVLRHVIHHPQEFLFDAIPQGAALKITDDSGTTTLVSLVRPRAGGNDA